MLYLQAHQLCHNLNNLQLEQLVLVPPSYQVPQSLTRLMQTASHVQCIPRAPLQQSKRQNLMLFLSAVTWQWVLSI